MSDESFNEQMTPEHTTRMAQHFESTNDSSRINWPILPFWLAALVFCAAFWIGVTFWIWS